MHNNHNTTTQMILENSLKSLMVLFIGSLLFVIIITIFPLVGSLTMDNFPILEIIKDNFKLLIPLFIASLLISPLLGWGSCKFKKRRFFSLFGICIGGCWVAIVFTLFIWSDFTIDRKEFGSFMLISAWGLIAYSFIIVPILVPAIIIIEKWTR